jgi:hypothetical protein
LTQQDSIPAQGGSATAKDPARTTRSATWDTYMRWNDALSQVFFGSAAAGLPVYLDLERDALTSSARLAAEDKDDSDPADQLVAAVRPTLDKPSDRGGIFASHLRRLSMWRADSGDPPPIIALLAVLTLAAEQMQQGEGLAANNYYDRLMPILEVTTEEDKKRVIRAYRECSYDLWETLNNWLEDLQGERGLPTAYAYSHAHIGRPLSQALIRAADREKLGEFFVELGLEGGTRLAPQDMEALLGEWIARVPSPASHQIRALWRRSGARERITDAACQLLEAWESADVVSSARIVATRDARPPGVRLVALVRTFPVPTLELNVTGPNLGGGRQAALLRPEDDSVVDLPLELEEVSGERWRLLEPERLGPGSLIEGLIRLRVEDVVFERRPKRVVPFKRDDLMQVLAEVERLQLGEDGMVMCQVDLAPLLDEALNGMARPGYERMPRDFEGCPEGWAVFTHVQVLGPLPPESAPWPTDFNCLQPLGTSQLVLAGGLRLPGRVRRWSSLAPPEIRVAAQGADHVSVRVERAATFQARVVELEREFLEPVAILPLDEARLEDGDYEIVASSANGDSAKGQSLGAVRMRLRSGDKESALPTHEAPLARSLARTGLGTQMADVWDGMAPAVRGALIVGDSVATVAEPRGSEVVGIPAWWHARASSDRAPAGMSRQRLPDEIRLPRASADCFMTGAHVLRLPTFEGKASSATIEGVCKHCGLVKRFPARFRARRIRKSADAGRALPDLPRIDVSHVPPVAIESSISPDTVLDALSHDGSGSAAWFEQLALQIEPSQLFADTFLRALDTLGHLEMKRDERSFSVVAWEVSPATLYGLPDETYVLAGHRSRRLLTALTDTINWGGGSIERTSQGSLAPDRIRVRGLGGASADVLAELVSERAGFEVRAATNAGGAMASVLPPLSGLIDALVTQPLPGFRSVRRWDPRTARWIETGDASVPGAYQLRAGFTTYCLRSETDIAKGTMRCADARVVKYASSLELGESLVGYEAASKVLYAPLGADLPGLYGRAAALCSGILPQEDTKQRLVRYQGVPIEVAESLRFALSR